MQTVTGSDPMVTDAIDKYIRDLDYDPRILLSVQPDGATETMPAKTTRSTEGSEVVLTTKTQHSLSKNLTDVAILRPTSGVIFPGALVRADQQLMEGLPTPISLPRGPLTISADMPGLLESSRTIENATNSSVQDAIASIIEEWNGEPKSQGYINAARSFLEVKTIFSSQQVALDMGFSAKWASGSASAQLSGSDNSETTSVLASYKQVFYTVSMDLPTQPSQVFGPTVNVDHVRQVTDSAHPPAYVRSVDYGRILMIKMETSSRETKADLQGALKQVTSGVEAEGSVKAKYDAIVRNSTFTVVAIGGGAQTASHFNGSESDLRRLADYIQADSTFRRDNPGAPVSYGVAFLKDGTTAMMGFSTNYTETASVRVASAYIKLRHSGGYVAKFTVTWDEPDANGIYQNKSWSSGKKTAGYTQQIDLPGDARNVKIKGEAATGLAWDPWGEAINVTLKTPDNKCYRIKGTTLDRSWDNEC